MEPSKPMDILNKLRRGSLDSNMDRRGSMESTGSGSLDSRPSSFDQGATGTNNPMTDNARFKMWRDARSKKMWQQEDPATAWYSA